MHTCCALRVAGVAEPCQHDGMDILESLGRFSLFLFGVAVAVALTTAWCLFVFLLTGRLPWMVRKYF